MAVMEPGRYLSARDLAIVGPRGRIRIEPTGPIDWDVTVPGSKSLTNRALICAALADGAAEIVGGSDSDDSRLLLQALRHAGNGSTVERGIGLGGRIPANSGEFSLGNAGTAVRFFTAFHALGEGMFTGDGDERMRQRPIGGLVDALNSLGGRVRYAGSYVGR